jgi:hypothetical protein
LSKSKKAKWIDGGCLSKKRYSTRQKAEKAVKKSKDLFNNDKKLYHCPLCCGYHLSSVDKI